VPILRPTLGYQAIVAPFLRTLVPYLGVEPTVAVRINLSVSMRPSASALK